MFFMMWNFRGAREPARNSRSLRSSCGVRGARVRKVKIWIEKDQWIEHVELSFHAIDSPWSPMSATQFGGRFHPSPFNKRIQVPFTSSRSQDF